MIEEGGLVAAASPDRVIPLNGGCIDDHWHVNRERQMILCLSNSTSSREFATSRKLQT